ncbi:MAG: hypothetical protein JJT96_15840 [Opitutales bacterium]|nr:hypothetical protein [Opitutales bacterium]
MTHSVIVTQGNFTQAHRAGAWVGGKPFLAPRATQPRHKGVVIDSLATREGLLGQTAIGKRCQQPARSLFSTMRRPR